MIEDSYDLVAAQPPRAQRLLLDWPGGRQQKEN